MKFCLPIERTDGLSSDIAPEFRAAPALLVVEGETFTVIDTADGRCDAVPDDVDVVICADGIGRRMFQRLRQRGVPIYTTRATTVAGALAAFAAGGLVELLTVQCGGGRRGRETRHAAGCDCGQDATGIN